MLPESPNQPRSPSLQGGLMQGARALAGGTPGAWLARGAGAGLALGTGGREPAEQLVGSGASSCSSALRAQRAVSSRQHSH